MFTIKTRTKKSLNFEPNRYADDPSSTQTYCRKCHGDMKREKGAVRRLFSPCLPPVRLNGVFHMLTAAQVVRRQLSEGVVMIPHGF